MASRKNRRTLKKRGKKSRGGTVVQLKKEENQSTLYPGNNPPQKPNPTPVPTPAPGPKPTQTVFGSVAKFFGYGNNKSEQTKTSTGGKKRSKTNKRRR